MKTKIYVLLSLVSVCSSLHGQAVTTRITNEHGLVQGEPVQVTEAVAEPLQPVYVTPMAAPVVEPASPVNVTPSLSAVAEPTVRVAEPAHPVTDTSPSAVAEPASTVNITQASPSAVAEPASPVNVTPSLSAVAEPAVRVAEPAHPVTDTSPSAVAEPAGPVLFKADESVPVKGYASSLDDDFAAFGLAFIEPLQYPRRDSDVAGLRLNLPYGRVKNSCALTLGIANVTDGDSRGVDIGIVNVTLQEFSGVQFGYVNLTRGDFRGVQWGDVSIGSKNVTGVQVGFLLAYAEEEFCGVQAGIVTKAKHSAGFTLGVINMAESMTGLQLGVVNVTDTAKGLQIGLVNVIRESPCIFFPIVNGSF